MSDKGYQIIEPHILSDWMGTPIHEGMLFGLLSWIVTQLLNEEDAKLSNLELSVISVVYVDKYPAIGIHYIDPNDEDISEYVEDKIERILNNKSVLDFLSWYFKNPVSWEDEWKQLSS